MNTDFLQSFLYFVNTLPASAGTVVFGGFRFGIFGWGGDARTRGSGRGCPRTCGHCVLALTTAYKCQDLSCYFSASLSLPEKIKEDVYCKLSIHKTTRKIFTGFSAVQRPTTVGCPRYRLTYYLFWRFNVRQLASRQ